MIGSVRLVNDTIQNFLSERYNSIADKILSMKLKHHYDLIYRENGITFNTIFDELIFVTLYESESFPRFQKNLQLDIEDIVSELIQLEDLVLQSIGIELTEKKQVDIISEEIFTIICNKLMSNLSEISEDRYNYYADKIIEDIKYFAFDGSAVGDYETTDYWEEFCLILQEGYDELYEICHDDIYSHIVVVLEKTNDSNLRILFAGSDEFDKDNIQDLFYSIEIEYIAEKLFESVRDKASMEDIDHILYPDEYDEEE